MTTLTQAQTEAARWATQAPEPATPAEALALICEGRRDEAAYRLLRHVRAEAARADHDADLAEAWARYEVMREALVEEWAKVSLRRMIRRLCLGIEVAA